QRSRYPSWSAPSCSSCVADTLVQPSCPTRRSSDLKSGPEDTGHYGQGYHWAGCSEPVLVFVRGTAKTHRNEKLRNAWIEKPGPRSEEHTSELQSRENLVCRLLLEKKKIVHTTQSTL